MPSIGDTVREGIQGMAAGREADQTVAGIGDTVDIFFLIAKMTTYS